MREIKFRAFAKSDKVMVDRVTLNNTPLIGVDFGTIDPNLVLMQFTGLHDKNGKEIYEGDVVKFWDDGTPDAKAIMSQVMFDRGAFYPRECVHDSMEVIGNIYENPELLK